MSARREVVGQLLLTDPAEYTDRSFQTACNWRTLALQPGEYDIKLERTYEGWPQSLTVLLNGITVDEYFVSRLFTASSVCEPRLGELHGVGLHAYAYIATDGAEAVARHFGVPGATVTFTDPAAAARGFQPGPVEAPSDDPYCAQHGARFDPAAGCAACTA